MRLMIGITLFFFSLSSHACFQGIFDAKAQALSQQLQAEQQAAQQLMKLADNRFKAEAKYGKNILDAWIKYQQERGKLERQFTRGPIKVAEAEIAMQREHLKVKRACRKEASTYQAQRTQELTNNPVTRNVATLSGTYTRLTDQYNIAYRRCMRDPTVLEEMQLAVKSYNLQVQSIRQDQNDAVTMIQELTRVTRQAQEYQIRTRADQRELFDYQEGVVRQMQARAIAMAQRIGSIRQTGAAMQCVFEIIQSIGGGGSSQ